MSVPGTLKLLDPRPYEGHSVELVIGIDVGTTFSGVCYSFLRPGGTPEVYSVTRFTDQLHTDSKVPSIMYYDGDGRCRAAGATAASEPIKDDAELEGWFKVELFKMHMKPESMSINTNGLTIPDLPESKTITEVMGDFLRYLYLETKSFIEDYHVDGSDLLDEVSDRTSFVLSHPNGWTGLPQQHLRTAAILGGLIEDSPDGREKVKFVSEGEASALSCLAGGLCPSELKRPGYRFMIADAGGGTLDVTSYEVTQSSPLRLRELTSSDCRFAGSVFVNMQTRKLLQEKLWETPYGKPENLDDVIERTFERETKRNFANAARLSWLRVTDSSHFDAERGIRRGSLRIDGIELARCFQFSVDQALTSIRAQINTCGGRAMSVWLVGGFSASPWLFNKLKEELRNDGIVVSHPDMNLSKAVAHGNVLFSFENTVISRVTRLTYGVVCDMPYIPCDSDHYRRRDLKYESLDGEILLPGKFDVIVHKNVEVCKNEKFTRFYQTDVDDPQSARCQISILSFDDEGSVPDWYDEYEDEFHHTCTVNADLINLCHESRLTTYNGKKCWTLSFDVEVSFGLTELQARVKWFQDGETKYGPATIFYE